MEIVDSFRSTSLYVGCLPLTRVYLAFRNLALLPCNWGFQSSRMWRSIIACVICDVSKQPVVLLLECPGPKKKFSVSSKDAAPHPKYRNVVIHYCSAVPFYFVCKISGDGWDQTAESFSTSTETTASSYRSNCMCWILEVQSLYIPIKACLSYVSVCTEEAVSNANYSL